MRRRFAAIASATKRLADAYRTYWTVTQGKKGFALASFSSRSVVFYGQAGPPAPHRETGGRHVNSLRRACVLGAEGGDGTLSPVRWALPLVLPSRRGTVKTDSRSDERSPGHAAAASTWAWMRRTPALKRELATSARTYRTPTKRSDSNPLQAFADQPHRFVSGALSRNVRSDNCERSCGGHPAL